MTNDKLNIAIVGAGISGLSAGYILSKHHRVVIYEQNNYIGGNARSVDIKIQNEDICVDTGCTSFNYKDYPNFLNFVEHLNMSVKSYESSFSSSFEQERIEFSTHSMSSFFKQTDFIFDRASYKMKTDLAKFEKLILTYKQKSKKNLREFLDLAKFGKHFERYYFIPLISTVFSGDNIFDINISYILSQLEKIGLLKEKELLYTIDGGIREYVKTLKQDISSIRTNSKIVNIQRMREKVSIEDDMGVNNFDKVIFACHPKEFIDTLQDIEDEEYMILNTFKQKDIHTILHSSADFMPIDKKNWSLYNHKGSTYDSPKSLGNSIWMNTILEKDTRYPLVLTTAYSKKPDFFYDEHTFKKPVFNQNTPKHQERVIDIQGHNNCFYCGSYLRNESLEGATLSALEVCNRLNTRAPWNIKD